MDSFFAEVMPYAMHASWSSHFTVLTLFYGIYAFYGFDASAKKQSGDRSKTLHVFSTPPSLRRLTLNLGLKSPAREGPYLNNRLRLLPTATFTILNLQNWALTSVEVRVHVSLVCV